MIFIGGFGSGGHNLLKNSISKYEKIDSFNRSEWVKDIKLSKVANNYGYRYYFICSCGNRYRYLYLKNGSYKCRKCHKLNYPSSRESKASIPFHKMQNILVNKFKVDIRGLTINEKANYIPPSRPKHMRKKTYHKRLLELKEAQEKFKKGSSIKCI